jgi:hypothetical protein
MTTNAVLAVPSINAAAGVAANPLMNLFRPKPANAVKAAGDAVPVGVTTAVQTADTLLASYAQLKVEVLDRSDRALWALLGQVYAYVMSVEGSALRRETRNELIRQIGVRDGARMSTAATTAAIVVRYVFADQSRQTWSNYATAIDKGMVIGVTADSFAGFLEQYGGVTKVVEHVFDHQADDQANAEATARAIREDKQNRVGLVGRLCTALAHASSVELAYPDPLHVWVPEKPNKDAKSKGKTTSNDGKLDPKYEPGKFVVFLSVRDASSGKYRVVQGNVFDRVFEDQMLATIAQRMEAPTEELAQAVVGLEQAVGFASN